MKKVLNLLFLLLLTVSTFSCNTDSQTKHFDYGKIENNKYTNEYFDFEMTLPQDWVVSSKEDIQRVKKVGQELIAGNDKNLRKMIEVSSIDNANLLQLTKYELGAPVNFNPSFALSVKNLRGEPGIKTGKDYLFHLRHTLKSIQIQYNYISENLEKKLIGGQEFYLMNAGIKIGNLEVKQSYYVTVLNGFVFRFFTTYHNDDSKAEFNKMIASMKFGK